MYLTAPIVLRQKLLMLSVARRAGLSDADADDLSEAIDAYPEHFICIYNRQPRYTDLDDELVDELYSLPDRSWSERYEARHEKQREQDEEAYRAAAALREVADTAVAGDISGSANADDGVCVHDAGFERPQHPAQRTESTSNKRFLHIRPPSTPWTARTRGKRFASSAFPPSPPLNAGVMHVR